MPFNYRKLRGKIREVFLTQSNFAEAMGLSERTLSLKLSGKVNFKQSEIIKAIELLGITDDDITDYFFCR